MDFDSTQNEIPQSNQVSSGSNLVRRGQEEEYEVKDDNENEDDEER